MGHGPVIPAARPPIGIGCQSRLSLCSRLAAAISDRPRIARTGAAKADLTFASQARDRSSFFGGRDLIFQADPPNKSCSIFTSSRLDATFSIAPDSVRKLLIKSGNGLDPTHIDPYIHLRYHIH